MVSASNIKRGAEDPGRRTVNSAFEAVYREHVGAVSRYFARRATDPQTVADLTSETFVRAMTSIHTFEGRGSLRGWLLAIARAVYAQHHEALADGRVVFFRLSSDVELQQDDLVDRIDAERAGRELLERISRLPKLERSAIELVVLEGLSSSDAAQILGVSTGALRVRLSRARARLRKGRNAP
jgi:RNA polymerase sigma-70 factor (ECF subfamily)